MGKQRAAVRDNSAIAFAEVSECYEALDDEGSDCQTSKAAIANCGAIRVFRDTDWDAPFEVRTLSKREGDGSGAAIAVLAVRAISIPARQDYQ